MTIKEFFEQFFDQCSFPYNHSMITFLEQNASLRHYQKREIIIEEDEPQHNLYFLVNGCLRCYELKDNGQEVTNSFFITPGVPFIAAISFEDDDTAMDTIQALEDTDLVLLPLSVLKILRVEYPRINGLLVDALCQSFRRFREILHVRTLKPMERYIWLRENYPDAADKVQKQYLASYLDMHKVVYSRCRTKYEEGHSEKHRQQNE